MFIPLDADPIALFEEWYAEARNCGLREPGAVCLATGDADGAPSARMLLLKGVDERGFTLFTNQESRKGRELDANPRAALCFYWMPLGKQVRVEGTVGPVSNDEADAYFASRSRESRIGAWASIQSRPMAHAEELAERMQRFEEEFRGKDVPRPPQWSGFRVAPDVIEFWLEKPHRLHDRVVYGRGPDGWNAERLYP
ncbi:MAG: pyridoxamine 5'-phosphate oxidase [bacterium]|nr:pyridoxamine 5'-phosphate oxidase [bacterium]